MPRQTGARAGILRATGEYLPIGTGSNPDRLDAM